MKQSRVYHILDRQEKQQYPGLCGGSHELICFLETWSSGSYAKMMRLTRAPEESIIKSILMTERFFHAILEPGG